MGRRLVVVSFTPPAPDVRKMLDVWMQWEKGDVTPGRTLADLKTAGLRTILEGYVADLDELAAQEG
jgi:hypothetical protein